MRDGSPFTVNRLQARADEAWKAANARATEASDQAAEPLRRITPHACRHTFASLMIAAGVNAKALSTFMGHANISITLDRYGHLMPGSETEAAELLDQYLARRANTATRDANGTAPR